MPLGLRRTRPVALPLLFLFSGYFEGVPAATAKPAKPGKSEAPAAPEPAPAPTPEPEAAPEPEASEPPETSADSKQELSAGPESAAPGAALPSIAFLDFGFRFDLGTFSRRSVIANDVRSNIDSVRAFDPNLTLGFLVPVNESWRVGAAFGYGFNYDPTNDGGVLGQLLVLDGRMEWNVAATSDLGVFLGPRVGLVGLIPGGELQEEIDQNQLFGYDTWNVPRIGFLVGADAGLRYRLTSLIYARASLGYAYTMMFLLDSQASAGGISASETWQIQASRLGGSLGVELAF